MYNTKTFMFVEDLNGYEKLVTGDFRSQYSSNAAVGTFETFTARYDLNIQFIDKKTTGYRIYKALYYHIYELLKNKGYFEEGAVFDQEAAGI